MHQIKRLFHHAVFSGCALATFYTVPGWALPPGNAMPYPQHEQADTQFYEDQYGHPGMPAYPGYTRPRDSYPQYRYGDYPPAGAYPGHPPVPAQRMPEYGRPMYGGGRYPQPMEVPPPPPDYESSAPAMPPTDVRVPAYPAPVQPAAVPEGTNKKSSGQAYELFKKDESAAAIPSAPADTSIPTPAATLPAEPDSLYEKAKAKVNAVFGKAPAETPEAVPVAEAPSAEPVPVTDTPAIVEPIPVAPVTQEPATPVEPAAVTPAAPTEPASAAGPESLYEKAKVEAVLDTDQTATPEAEPSADAPAVVAPAPVAPVTDTPAIVEPAPMVPAMPEPATTVEPAAVTPAAPTEPASSAEPESLYEKAKAKIDEVLGKDTAETPEAVPATEAPAAESVTPTIDEPAPVLPATSEATDTAATEESATLDDRVKTRLQELLDAESPASESAPAGDDAP